MKPCATRRIFDTLPSNWQKLEAMVAQGFDEMMYKSSRNYEITTVRGRIKIDVYAIKKDEPIPTVILCECKYWNKPVGQNVIHAFRTICTDVGAHFGLIISKRGFQSGAKETSKATNIHLLDFLEFEKTFFDEWRSGIFHRFAKMTDVLMPLLWDDPHIESDGKLKAKLRSVNVFEKYEMFFGQQRYTSYFIESGVFPVRISDPRGDPRSIKTIVVKSPRQYYEIGAKGFADARAYFGI